MLGVPGTEKEETSQTKGQESQVEKPPCAMTGRAAIQSTVPGTSEWGRRGDCKASRGLGVILNQKPQISTQQRRR